MAKRTRSQDQTNPTDPTAQPKAPRPRSARASELVPPPTVPANAVERNNDELPDIPEPGDAADRAARSESMASEPSEEDIRLRAYQRYLERGGGHGAHFDDWLEAERELKGRRS
jgi:hypothetical protein